MARPRLLSDEQILTATRAAVLELGPHISVDVVAERLNVTAPALLKRFGNREALWVAALKPPDQLPFLDEVMELPRGGRPLVAELEALFALFFDFFIEMVPRVMALRESGLDHDKVFGGKHRGFEGMLKVMRHWLERAAALRLVEVSDVETVVLAMVGALQFRVFHAHVTKTNLTSRANREHITELALLYARALAPVRVRLSARSRARRLAAT